MLLNQSEKEATIPLLQKSSSKEKSKVSLLGSADPPKETKKEAHTTIYIRKGLPSYNGSSKKSIVSSIPLVKMENALTIHPQKKKLGPSKEQERLDRISEESRVENGKESSLTQNSEAFNSTDISPPSKTTKNARQKYLESKPNKIIPRMPEAKRSTQRSTNNILPPREIVVTIPGEYGTGSSTKSASMGDRMDYIICFFRILFTIIFTAIIAGIIYAAGPTTRRAIPSSAQPNLNSLKPTHATHHNNTIAESNTTELSNFSKPEIKIMEESQRIIDATPIGLKNATYSYEGQGNNHNTPSATRQMDLETEYYCENGRRALTNYAENFRQDPKIYTPHFQQIAKDIAQELAKNTGRLDDENVKHQAQMAAYKLFYAAKVGFVPSIYTPFENFQLLIEREVQKLKENIQNLDPQDNIMLEHEKSTAASKIFKAAKPLAIPLTKADECFRGYLEINNSSLAEDIYAEFSELIVEANEASNYSSQTNTEPDELKTGVSQSSSNSSQARVGSDELTLEVRKSPKSSSQANTKPDKSTADDSESDLFRLDRLLNIKNSHLGQYVYKEFNRLMNKQGSRKYEPKVFYTPEFMEERCKIGIESEILNRRLYAREEYSQLSTPSALYAQYYDLLKPYAKGLIAAILEPENQSLVDKLVSELICLNAPDQVALYRSINSHLLEFFPISLPLDLEFREKFYDFNKKISELSCECLQSTDASLRENFKQTLELSLKRLIDSFHSTYSLVSPRKPQPTTVGASEPAAPSPTLLESISIFHRLNPELAPNL